MSIPWNEECLQAVNLAKKSLPEDEPIDVGPLLDATFHGTRLKEELGELAKYFQQPRPHREASDEVRVSSALLPLLRPLADRDAPVTPDELFFLLIASDQGEGVLSERGMSPETLHSLRDSFRSRAAALERQAAAAPAAAPGAGRNGAESSWRASRQRQEALRELAAFGKVLTEEAPPSRGTADMDESLDALYMILVKPKRHNAIITGYPGTGKTRLVYEFARRLVNQDPSIPEVLRERDIFELVPTFLKAGTSYHGEFEARIRTLIQVLEKNPNIILFVDEIHSFLQSGMHTGANPALESLKGVLGRGEITCIGCTTVAEFKHYIAPDEALLRRFDRIQIEPPSTASTIRILKTRRPNVQEYYGNLEISDEVLEKTVELTERFLPGRYQPDKSIQLLDQACAYTVTRKTASASGRKTQVTEDTLMRALELTLGRKAFGEERFTKEEIYDGLRAHIRGQDDVLARIATALVTGMSKLKQQKGPRCVFLFGGPTGVGKTRVATLLAETLFDDAEALIRIDCNTLQGHGEDAGRIQNLLLGTPPGYLGYVRGQGGALSRIRERPRSIVLFDEFEKAGRAVGEILLKLLDDGVLEDVEGNRLDFRQSYVVFTTNVGCRCETPVGYATPDSKHGELTISVDTVQEDLISRAGLGPEFVARIRDVFLFYPLDQSAIADVMSMELDRLVARLEDQGYNLLFDEHPKENSRKKQEFIAYLARRWQPHFGVRHALTILDNRVTEQLCVAEVRGLLETATIIKLTFEQNSPAPGGAQLRLKGNTLEVLIT